MAGAKRVQSIEALRGIGFLLIFCSHCTFIEAFSSSWGGLGVSIFIILSGYVVTFNSETIYIRNDIKTVAYVAKRIKKIYPLHAIALCVRLAFDSFLGNEIPVLLILLNFSMLKSFVPKREIFYSLGGVSWYLTLVCLFALLTPIFLRVLGILKKKQGGCLYALIMILIFRALWIYFFHASKNSLWLTYVNPFFRTTDYFLGMLLGANSKNIKTFLEDRIGRYIVFSYVMWTMFIGYIVALSMFKMPWYHQYLRTILSMGMIILFTVSNLSNKWSRTWLYENKFYIYLGSISFELFLTHTQVKYIIMNMPGRKSYNSIMLLGLIFVFSIAVSQIYSGAETLVKGKMRNYRKVK